MFFGEKFKYAWSLNGQPFFQSTLYLSIIYSFFILWKIKTLFCYRNYGNIKKNQIFFYLMKLYETNHIYMLLSHFRTIAAETIETIWKYQNAAHWMRLYRNCNCNIKQYKKVWLDFGNFKMTTVSIICSPVCHVLVFSLERNNFV